MKRAEAIAAALARIGRGRVLWVDVEPVGEGVRVSADALPEGEHDAAVVGLLPGELGPRLRAVRERVREGGLIAVVLPIEREGWRGAAQRALATFDVRRRPRALEEVCGALLGARVTSIQVIEIDGVRGEAVVHGLAR